VAVSWSSRSRTVIQLQAVRFLFFSPAGALLSSSAIQGPLILDAGILLILLPARSLASLQRSVPQSPKTSDEIELQLYLPSLRPLLREIAWHRSWYSFNVNVALLGGLFSSSQEVLTDASSPGFVARQSRQELEKVVENTTSVTMSQDTFDSRRLDTAQHLPFKALGAVRNLGSLNSWIVG
jgi:hypothetical protein